MWKGPGFIRRNTPFAVGASDKVLEGVPIQPEKAKDTSLPLVEEKEFLVDSEVSVEAITPLRKSFQSTFD